MPTFDLRFCQTQGSLVVPAELHFDVSSPSYFVQPLPGSASMSAAELNLRQQAMMGLPVSSAVCLRCVRDCAPTFATPGGRCWRAGYVTCADGARNACSRRLLLRTPKTPPARCCRTTPTNALVRPLCCV